VKFGSAVSELCVQTARQTDRYGDEHGCIDCVVRAIQQRRLFFQRLRQNADIEILEQLSYTDLDEGECDRRFDAHERHFIVVVSRLATSRQCQQSIQPAGVRHGPLVGRPRGVAKPYTEAAHVLELELAERRRAHEMNC